MTFAENTSVSVEKSRAEIERLVMRYGANQFVTGYEDAVDGKPARAMIGFRRNGWHVRFLLPLPDRSEEQFHRTPTGKPRTKGDAERSWEQACRSRWRSLCLTIKAKLEAVECGITTFEDEFLAHFVLPNGQSVGNWMVPQIKLAYEEAKMPPPLLLEDRS